MSQAPGQPPANSESFLPQSTVMIVDDNVQNVELLQAFLEALPVKIITANDGVGGKGGVPHSVSFRGGQNGPGVERFRGCQEKQDRVVVPPLSPAPPRHRW